MGRWEVSCGRGAPEHIQNVASEGLRSVHDQDVQSRADYEIEVRQDLPSSACHVYGEMVLVAPDAAAP